MPLPRKLKKTINRFAKKDGKIAKKFFPYTEVPGDLKLYVLAQSGRNGKKFTLLATIDKWSAAWDSYRDLTKFSVSTTDENFGDHETPDETFFEVLRRSTHVAKSNGEIYATQDGDSVQAYFFDFAYKFFGRLEVNKVFNIETDIEETP